MKDKMKYFKCEQCKKKCLVRIAEFDEIERELCVYDRSDDASWEEITKDEFIMEAG